MRIGVGVGVGAQVIGEDRGRGRGWGSGSMLRVPRGSPVASSMLSGRRSCSKRPRGVWYDRGASRAGAADSGRQAAPGPTSGFRWRLGFSGTWSTSWSSSIQGPSQMQSSPVQSSPVISSQSGRVETSLVISSPVPSSHIQSLTWSWSSWQRGRPGDCSTRLVAWKYLTAPDGSCSGSAHSWCTKISPRFV